MNFKILFCLFFIFPILVCSAADRLSTETAHLVVKDLTGTLSAVDLSKYAATLEELFVKISDFWKIEYNVNTNGKVAVALDEPEKGTPYFTVSEIIKDGKKSIHSIHIMGTKGQPMELAHKITHTLFPQEDKLIRNLMGIPVEMRFGNPLSFPLCGYSPHAWVLAMQETGLYAPLSKLGKAHEDWGMAFKNGLPVVTDQVRQHTSYATAGSFGDYLQTVYGAEKIKAFYKLSNKKDRPFSDVFGITLEKLEADWLTFLKSKQKELSSDTAFLVKLLKANPAKARFAAEKSKTEKK